MKFQDLWNIFVATVTTKAYELTCSVMVVMNCSVHTADCVRFGLLHKYDDVCIYAPCIIALHFIVICHLPSQKKVLQKLMWLRGTVTILFYLTLKLH
jgi:hypothetical protein